MVTNKSILKHSEHYFSLQYKPNMKVCTINQVIISIGIQNLLSRPKQICSVDDGDLPMKYGNRHCHYRHCHQHVSLEERGIFQKVCLPFLFIFFVCLLFVRSYLKKKKTSAAGVVFLYYLQ